MSRTKAEKSGDQLYGSNDTENSKESNPLLARLYHPQTLQVIEKIAALRTTSENDRRRLLEIVNRQKALMVEHNIEPESINRQLPQTNFEWYVTNLLSDEGTIERDSLITHILQRDIMATASTVPPSAMPQVTLAKVTEDVGSKVNMALSDAERLEKLRKEVFGDDKKENEYEHDVIKKPRFIDIDEDDKFMVFRQKGDSIFPGDVLTVVDVTFEKQTLIHVENESGNHFILDPDMLKQIAKKANPYGHN